MSFSKARLRRFNEEIPQVPSPGRYDPKQDSSVKGAAMPMSKRFPGQNTTSSSLDNIERASTAFSGVVFRTPQLLRKVALTPRTQYLKEKNFDTSGSDILSSSEERPSATKKTVSRADFKRLEDELHSLTEKHYTMLLNREMEVNMLKEEINEIKIHEAELKEILEEKSKLASDRHKETLHLKDNLETMVEKIKVDREEHYKFINNLKLEISKLQNNKYELETVLGEKQSVIVTINDKYSDLEHELKNLQEENFVLEQANSSILMGAEEKLQDLEERVTSRLQTLPEVFNIKYEEQEKTFHTKMNFFTHEFNLKSKEVIDQVKQSQDKVKELERLIDKKVNEFTEDIKEADERCKYLYRELCKVEEQRDELVVSDLEKKLAIIDIQEKSDFYQNELDQSKNTCRKYQITLNTMNETISALSNRLHQSELEVERLNGVEKDLELQKQLLEEKSQLLLTDILALRQSIDKMEEEIIQDVSALKEFLEAKADLFKVEALKTEQALNNRIQEKQYAIDLLLKENEYFKKELERKDCLIEEQIKKGSNYEETIEELRFEHLKLEEELNEKLSAQKNLYEILSEKLKSTSALVSNLQYLKSQHESQITSLINQLEEHKADSVSLKRINLEQISKIQSLQSEIEQKKDVEVRQQQYIDDLISDLALEKERCETVETEKSKIEHLLHNAKHSFEEQSEETDKLKQTLKNYDEKISSLEIENVLLKQKLIKAENNIVEFKTLGCEAQTELERKISDLQCQLNSAKDKIKTEIPKLEHDNINKAENILELNLSVDSLKEELNVKQTKISCLEAEKDSLNSMLEESKSTVCDLKKIIQDKNLTISSLNVEQVRTNSLCQDLFSQIESFSYAFNKEDDDMKQKADEAMKLAQAEEQISELEMQLSEKEKALKNLTHRFNEIKDIPHLDEVNQLREKLEEMQAKYNAVVEDRDKLSQEVGNLMGHQNIHQKIKKVAELKQHITELRDENEVLRLENQRFRAKVESSKKQKENKENVTVPRKEEQQKVIRQCSAKKKLMSPVALKPSNH